MSELFWRSVCACATVTVNELRELSRIVYDRMHKPVGCGAYSRFF